MTIELNKRNQFIVALDRSRSMSTKDAPGGLSRLEYVVDKMKPFVEAAGQWDPDGISLYMFDHEVVAFTDVADMAAVNSAIASAKPRGSTATHLVLEAAWREHVGKKSGDPNNVTYMLLFTDGVPDDKGMVEKEIIAITERVSAPEEFRVAMITVGERTGDLDVWLKALDDNLTSKGAKHDIISIMKIEDVDFYDAVGKAIDG